MPRCLDTRLQLVLEPHANYEMLISESVRGGVTCVQFRDKNLSDRDFYDKAREIQAICRSHKVPLIINDRVDIALAIEAQAVHLGQSDMPFAIARRLLPEFMSIGLSAECLEDVKQAEKLDLDYLAISPVFLTPTKPDTAEPFGLEGLRKAREYSRHPLVAIGGVNASNFRELRQAGADGLAVVTAICRARSPYEAARSFAS